MSTHKHIDKICCIAVVLTLALTVVFMSGAALGLEVMPAEMGYESRLFDSGRVHTVDIVMDDWDSFIESCENEEYALCSAVIDGESYSNIAIRAKGNTSLSNVSSMGSDRYSFKIEFDQYDSTKSYYGLDKLSLNNLIQDNTMMKDYLVYTMMDEFGVAAPLCSYVYITVNGEDWGLYLAVEGIEESFLQRNYGSDYGELYKPDSMGFGGGRGNGRDFDMREFEDRFNAKNETEDSTENPGMSSEPDGNMPLMPEGFAPPERPENFDPGKMPDMGSRRGGGGFGMGSSDVKLQYIDDDLNSYSNIFDSAKTDVSDADKNRLISSLEALAKGEDLEDTVNIEEVLRYFVVHNFVVNGDSYTGSMIHNYYLYEEDGQLSMIPWDYNLAFGTFQGGAAGSVNEPIDSPVSGGDVSDRPMVAWIFENEAYTALYHQYFAEFISIWFDSGYFETLLSDTIKMLSPYVEKDPRKFCTYAEFEKGTEAIRDFCLLRAESVSGQLDGTIPSTSEGQTADDSALIDAGALSISDMGTMGRGMGERAPGDSTPEGGTAPGGNTQGGGFPGMGGAQPGMQPPFDPAASSSSGTDTATWILLGVSGIVLVAGLVFASKFKR